ncbi:MAG: hypothetical protein AB7U50_04865, partial [Bacilli bacterium]
SQFDNHIALIGLMFFEWFLACASQCVPLFLVQLFVRTPFLAVKNGRSCDESSLMYVIPARLKWFKRKRN